MTFFCVALEGKTQRGERTGSWIQVSYVMEVITVGDDNCNRNAKSSERKVKDEVMCISVN